MLGWSPHHFHPVYVLMQITTNVESLWPVSLRDNIHAIDTDPKLKWKENSKFAK